LIQDIKKKKGEKRKSRENEKGSKRKVESKGGEHHTRTQKKKNRLLVGRFFIFLDVLLKVRFLHLWLIC